MCCRRRAGEGRLRMVRADTWPPMDGHSIPAAAQLQPLELFFFPNANKRARMAARPPAGVHWPKRPDLMRIAGLGVCLFLSQLFYITGIELSGVVVATCMQVRAAW